MGLPTPPTDNLYKFCALTGVIIFLASIYLPFKLQSEIGLKIIDVELEMAKVKIEFDHLQDEREDLKNDRENLKEKSGMKRKPMDLPTVVAEKELKEILDRSTTILSSLKNQELNLEEVRGARERTSLLVTQMKTISYTSTILIFIGLGIACFGFHQWYRKVQVFQDKILQKQAASRGV